MNAFANLRQAGSGFVTAIQFLTRIPVPSPPYSADSLARAVKFFPFVGLVVGALAALLYGVLTPHLPRIVAALCVVIFLVCIAGCLHEDGLADTADAFGGGWNREQILLILRDSRIGSYGAAALALSLLARVFLLSSLPVAHMAQYLIAAHVLCRWTTLPLSYYLSPARGVSENGVEGQGARIAKLTTRASLIAGTLFAFAVVIAGLRSRAVAPIISAVAITLMSALYYLRRIGGVTGDCFGATNQLTEIAVYFCGVWNA
jgi:adenosylcobinamide-GDP ribazoletransferase